MTTSSKADNDSPCGLLYLDAYVDADYAQSCIGFAKVTILDT